MESRNVWPGIVVNAVMSGVCLAAVAYVLLGWIWLLVETPTVITRSTDPAAYLLIAFGSLVFTAWMGGAACHYYERASEAERAHRKARPYTARHGGYGTRTKTFEAGRCR